MYGKMMNRPSVIKSVELANWIAGQVEGVCVPSGLRERLAGASQSIALDYHSGLGILANNQRFAPVFALLRLLFEAYVRGKWLFESATDDELTSIARGEAKLPRIGDMLIAIEGHLEASERILTNSQQRNWNTLNGFTHTGALHLQRYITSEGIEPNYSGDEVDEALNFADVVALLSACEIACVADDCNLAEIFLERSRLHAV